jgi:class 3 adenylate cyclase/tetratricopeptide (TPR) repeat protein
MTLETLTCRLCGFNNAAEVRFCGGCGAPLTATDTVEERRRVAVLFADICNFTRLVADGDAEEVKAAVEELLAELGRQVTLGGGFVEQFIGDAVMAVFGVPRVSENNAERAVDVGLRMLERTRGFGGDGPAFQIRVGVHYGEVILTRRTRTPRGAYQVFGHVVNVASRLEETGIPGAVVVSRDVHRRTSHVFDYQPLESLMVKGLSEPLERFQVLRKKPVRGKGRGIPGLSAPLVGREKELAALEAAYDEVLRQRRVRAVVVHGVAGIGKTRLVEEFALGLTESVQPPRYLAGRCLVYAAAPAYHPLNDILTRLIGADDETPPLEIRRRLEELIADLVGGDVDPAAVEQLAGLIGAATDEDGTGSAAGELLRARVRHLLERLLTGAARVRPLVILIEDLQWADDATLGLLLHLLGGLEEAPVLFLFNTRPPEPHQHRVAEFLERLDKLANSRLLRLRELTPQQSRRLIAELLAVERLSERSRRLIIERAAGNPFFVEELIKVLIDRGVLINREDHWEATREIEELDIPDTVEDVLRARLDRLSDEERRVIQTASVVGEVFWRRIVSWLLDGEVTGELSRLEHRDLIRRQLDSLFSDDLEYIFKHSLLRDTVYNGLLKRIRRELHLRIARWVEEHYAERLEGYLSLVAYHYENGGDPERAARFYLRAGVHAARLYAADEAAHCFARAAANGTQPTLLHVVHREWGGLLSDIGEHPAALEHFDAALESTTDTVERAAVRELRGNSLQLQCRYDEALAEFAGAEGLLGDGREELLRVKLVLDRAWVRYLQGDYARARELTEQSLGLFRALGREDEEALRVLARLYTVYAATVEELGELERGRRFNQRTLELYEQLGDLGGVMTTLNNIGAGEYVDGDFDDAVAHLERSFELGARCGDVHGQAVNCCNLGFLFLLLDDQARARSYFELYLELNARVDNRLGDGYAHSGLARLAAESGDAAVAEEHYQRALGIFKELGAERNYLDVRLEQAGFLAATGRENKAWALMDEVYDRVGYDTLTLTELELLFRITERRPLTGAEVARLRRVVERAEKLIDKERFAVERLDLIAVLARLYGLLGEAAARERHTREAAGLLESIEARIGDDEHRRGFRRRLQRLGYLD